jgi:hypothetical protein
VAGDAGGARKDGFTEGDVAALVGEDGGDGFIGSKGADLWRLVFALGLELQILNRRLGGFGDGGIEVGGGDENAIIEGAVFRFYSRGDEDRFLGGLVPCGVEGLFRKFAGLGRSARARSEGEDGGIGPETLGSAGLFGGGLF